MNLKNGSVKLDIDASSMIYQIVNSGGSRPDLIVKKGSQNIGCIEIELGSENVSQTENYSKIHIKVFTICGLRSHNSHLSLEEIKKYLLDSNKENFNEQQKLSVNYLTKLIETYIYGFNSNVRTSISEKVSQHTFFKIILTELKDIISENISSIFPGQIVVDTVKDQGFSLKVFSNKSNNKKLALISRSGGREAIMVQSEKKYLHYLSDRGSKVKRWIEFIKIDLRCDISDLDLTQRLSIPISTISEDKLLKMIGLIRELA